MFRNLCIYVIVMCMGLSSLGFVAATNAQNIEYCSYGGKSIAKVEKAVTAVIDAGRALALKKNSQSLGQSNSPMMKYDKSFETMSATLYNSCGETTRWGFESSSVQ